MKKKRRLRTSVLVTFILSIVIGTFLGIFLPRTEQYYPIITMSCLLALNGIFGIWMAKIGGFLDE